MKAEGGLAMCNDCISLSVDITEGIQKEAVITFCKNCERLQVPPTHWIFAPRESRELLGACLKRLRGLNKVRLIDAKYVWTEPHSRRTKIKVLVQGEAPQFPGVLIQQGITVNFTETSAQCPDCAKSYTATTWRANIQVRQKVDHKKTFFYLEQLILKNHAHKYTVSIQENKEGLDFFYNQRNHALKMLEFLSGVIPVRVTKSSELISQNIHTSAKSYKFSYSVEIVPICKEDLVVLPKKLAKSLGISNQLTLCYRIGNAVHLIDPTNLQTAELAAGIYWRSPFSSLSTGKNLTEYVVLDIEPVGPANGKFALADVTVARSVDLGSNDTTYYVRTHLGGILHPGDTVMGYHLSNTNFNHALWDEIDQDKTPEVILVKKSYPDKIRSKTRNWKVKRMAKEYNDDTVRATGREKTKNKSNDAFERAQRDYEEFLRELEEDPELRTEVNLYKNVPEVDAQEENGEEGEDDDESEELPGVNLDELKLEDDLSSDLSFSDDNSDEPDDENDS
ncbi:ribosome-binding protein NMD3 [Sugiyamaella lignohabitans]|uniref:60S ribosomal export protein NMD3 n=1 Tax=Sugiyamaella lignohabitans TaxID=796027 RepID=A0A167CM61_9ASCO|nr:ribosome-binding protein NMD3 [Sugiyamaella lignohabitans]ANB11879.1 ribosome-binding protein NMD3 [Sugiyamaella lignohabitans]